LFHELSSSLYLQRHDGGTLNEKQLDEERKVRSQQCFDGALEILVVV
jgi:hypothetical protein